MEASDHAYSPNALIVDLAAIRHNTKEIRRVIGPDRFFFAAIKGNAYGHGLVEVARAVLESGADGLSMVHVSDAVILRDAGIIAPILLFGGNLGDPATLDSVERHDLIVTVVDAESIAFLAANASRDVRVFLKIDVGLERLGCRPEDAVDLVRAIASAERLRLEGVYTHMNGDGLYGDGGAESDLTRFVDWQFRKFTGVLEELDSNGIEPPRTIAVSSPGLMMGDRMMLNGVDVGRLLFGLMPDIPAGVGLDLRPALRGLTSRLLQVKALDRTEFLPEAGFEVRPGMRIGVMPMGHGDGLDSVHAGEVLVRGRRAPLIGLFYEHARLDLTSIPEAAAGDEVVIIGRQAEAEITLAEVVRHQGLRASTGIASLVRESVPRRHVDEER